MNADYTPKREPTPGMKLDLSVLPMESQMVFEQYRRMLETVPYAEIVRQAHLNYFNLLISYIVIEDLRRTLADLSRSKDMQITGLIVKERKLTNLLIERNNVIKELAVRLLNLTEEADEDGTPI